jgi:hypothetical protein
MRTKHYLFDFTMYFGFHFVKTTTITSNNMICCCRLFLLSSYGAAANGLGSRVGGEGPRVRPNFPLIEMGRLPPDFRTIDRLAPASKKTMRKGQFTEEQMVARPSEGGSRTVQYPRYGYRRIRIFLGVPAVAGGGATSAAQLTSRQTSSRYDEQTQRPIIQVARRCGMWAFAPRPVAQPEPRMQQGRDAVTS